jgi:hypothetical protein
MSPAPYDAQARGGLRQAEGSGAGLPSTHKERREAQQADERVCR